MENDKVCYICLKEIKDGTGYSIGKNIKGVELHKHSKCKPYILSEKESEEIKNWTEYPEVKKK